MQSDTIPHKLAEIRKTNLKQYKKWIRNFRIAFILLICAFVLAAIFGASNPATHPLWELPLVFQIDLLAMFATVIGAVVLIARSKPVSFEKRVFLKVLDGYEHIRAYTTLNGTQSQDESSIQEAEKVFMKVSSRLLNKSEIEISTDLEREVHGKYAKIGELVQTKILFYLRKNKDLLMIQSKILLLASAFAEANITRIDSCISSLENIKEGEQLKPKGTFLQDRPRLHSILRHGMRLGVSVLVVVSVAVVMSYVLSKSLSDFAGYILTAIFALFAAWEVRSR